MKLTFLFYSIHAETTEFHKYEFSKNEQVCVLMTLSAVSMLNNVVVKSGNK